MKTALEWFRTLPEEEGKLAIANTSSSNLEMVYPSCYDALESSFVWAATKQGLLFWNNFHSKIYHLEEGNAYTITQSHQDLLEVAKQTKVLLEQQGMGNSVFAKQVNLAIEKAEKIK